MKSVIRKLMAAAMVLCFAVSISGCSENQSCPAGCTCSNCAAKACTGQPGCTCSACAKKASHGGCPAGCTMPCCKKA